MLVRADLVCIVLNIGPFYTLSWFVSLLRIFPMILIMLPCLIDKEYMLEDIALCLLLP